MRPSAEIADTVEPTPAEGKQSSRRVSNPPLLSVRYRTLPLGLGYGLAHLIAGGIGVLFLSMHHGSSDEVSFGLVILAGGVIPTWCFLASRIHFHATHVMTGWFVSRNRCLWSEILPYDKIAKVAITHNTYSTCGVSLVSRDTDRYLWITARDAEKAKAILRFLSERLDRSVFDERALKLLATGELEKFNR